MATLDVNAMAFEGEEMDQGDKAHNTSRERQGDVLSRELSLNDSPKVQRKTPARWIVSLSSYGAIVPHIVSNCGYGLPIDFLAYWPA